MKRRLFDPEGWLCKPLGVLGDIVILSTLWAVCCIPILTIGSATTALYDTAVHVFRRKDDKLFARFFGTFKRELLSGVLSTLLWAAVLLLEYFLYTRLAAALPESEQRGVILTVVLILAVFFTLCVLSWVFPTLSRFTFRTFALNATALRLAFGHILPSAVLALLILGSGLLCFLFGIPLMVLPALTALLASFLIEPVFRPFEHPEESGETAES